MLGNTNAMRRAVNLRAALWYPNSRSGSSNLEMGVYFEANAR